MYFYLIFGLTSLTFLLLAFTKRRWLLFVTLGLLPLSPFLQSIISKYANLSSQNKIILGGWKELAITFLTLYLIYYLIRNKPKVKLRTSDFLILGLFALAAISFIFTGLNIINLALGLKYSILFLLLYLVIRLLPWQKNDLKKATGIIIAATSLVTIFAYLQGFVLNTKELQALSFQTSGAWAPGQGLNLAQKAGDFTRLVSTLSGPNQLGIYLAFICLLLTPLAFKSKQKIHKYSLLILTLLSLGVIILTFSRTAWLSLIIGLLALIYFYYQKRGVELNKKLLTVSLILLIGLASLSFLIFNTNVDEVFARHTDQTRLNYLKQSWQTMLDNPLGLGIGTAGPATQWGGVNKPIISENFYLQIGLELGWLGVAGFFTLLWLLVKRLSKLFKGYRNEYFSSLSWGLLGATIALAFSGLFLHTLTDASLIYTFAILLGLVDNYHYKQKLVSS